VTDINFFESVLDQILTETDLLMEQEHGHIYEFFEGDFPVFKLIFSPPDATKGEDGLIMISFQLELDIPSAILWFLKLSLFAPELQLTSSYLKDDSGATYLGQDAQVLFRQQIEREVLNSIKLEAAKRKAKLKPATKAVNLNASDDAEAALAAFDEWDPKRNGRKN
jgi:hypothetical protein